MSRVSTRETGDSRKKSAAAILEDKGDREKRRRVRREENATGKTTKTPEKHGRTRAGTPKESAASTEIVEMEKRPRRSGHVKPLEKDFLEALARAIRDAVLPHIASGKGREVVGTATSGDATFELDKVAERALLAFLKNAHAPVAYYSEDAGYTTFTSGQPQHLLVVDPVDGTRAAKSGFEGCVVSVVSTRVIERPRMADVDNACIMEIMGHRTFYAERGKGTRIFVDGRSVRPKLSQNTNLECVSWAMTVTGRPAELIFPTAARLIDLTTLKGGFFACNSTAFSLTRLVTNQLDAYVDFANRFLRDLNDKVEDYFVNAGRGAVIGPVPYDLAGALLVAEEAGCKVTDAYGRGFDEVLLLDNSVNNQQSIIAAANAELHEKLLTFFETRIRQYEELISRRSSSRQANTNS